MRGYKVNEGGTGLPGREQIFFSFLKKARLVDQKFFPEVPEHGPGLSREIPLKPK